MRVHFIAIGGSAMHNLAIALHKKGYQVSGSDDEIFDPARRRLLQHGLLPERTGWDPQKISSAVDAVILGMHAKADNPELRRAGELGIKTYSYPEFLFEQSKNKTRVVIGGSHGKTTITSMILHVLKQCHIDTDYMVGALIDGFDVMVRTSEKAPFMVLEGDEYLSSALDPRPKFHIYRPHIALISGIAWDHMNVFPTFDIYLEQFRQFIHCMEPNGKLIYCHADNTVKELCESEAPPSMTRYPYELPEYTVGDKGFVAIWKGKQYSLPFFGQHNMLNMNGARVVCEQLGVDPQDFFEAIQSFRGAGNRLEMVYDKEDIKVFRDFAHAPSKVAATVRAVREMYPGKNLLACLELHTYSSLNQEFLGQYAGSLAAADKPFVFFSDHALALKKLPALSPAGVAEHFEIPANRVYNEADALLRGVISELRSGSVLLLMSSGNFGGLGINRFTEAIGAK